MIANQLPAANPYTTGETTALFYGRDALFTWVKAALLQARPEQGPEHPVILRGPSRIGKTAVLKQIEAGQLAPAYTAVYIDLTAVALDSASAFLWDVAQTAVRRLQKSFIKLPPLNHTAFVADPLRAFREQLILPAALALQESQPAQPNSRLNAKPLFLFDNLNAVAQQIEAGILKEDLIQAVHQTIYQNYKAACLFSWQSNQTPLPDAIKTIFSQAQLYDIGPLEPEEAIDLIRQPVNGTLFKNVAEYIANVAHFQPYEIQQLCYSLFERRRTLNLNYITVADVKAVQRTLVETSQYNTVLGATEQPTFSIDPRGSAIHKVRRTVRPAIWQQGPFLMTAGLLLLLLTAVLALPRITQASWPDMLASINPQPTPTAVATIAPTVQIVIIVESPTPQPTATPTLTLTPTQTPSTTPTPSQTPTPTITPTPTPSVLPDSFVRRQDNMPMVLIPGGSFMMGSGDNDFPAAPDERPQHLVTLDTFYIDKYEVSVEQYASLLNRIGGYEKLCDGVDCVHPRHVIGNTSYLIEEDLGDGTLQYYALTGFANYPINYVTWYGANFYCQAMGGRLPTEAEWEYAARGTDGRIYPWGDEPPNKDRAVYQSDSFNDLLPVDALPRGASPFGVYGMAGSMWEWVDDWYNENYYSDSPSENPPGPEIGLTKVMRGGAWPNNHQKDRIRVANRNMLDPIFLSSMVGFRCAYDP